MQCGVGLHGFIVWLELVATVRVRSNIVGMPYKTAQVKAVCEIPESVVEILANVDRELDEWW